MEKWTSSVIVLLSSLTSAAAYAGNGWLLMSESGINVGKGDDPQRCRHQLNQQQQQTQHPLQHQRRHSPTATTTVLHAMPTGGEAGGGSEEIIDDRREDADKEVRLSVQAKQTGTACYAQTKTLTSSPPCAPDFFLPFFSVHNRHMWVEPVMPFEGSTTLYSARGGLCRTYGRSFL